MGLENIRGCHLDLRPGPQQGHFQRFDLLTSEPSGGDLVDPMLSLWTHAEPGPGPRALMEALTGGPDQALASRYRERLSRGERALLARCHRGGEEGPFGTASPAWLLCQWPEEPQGFRDFAMGCPPRCRALHGIPQPTLHLQPLGFTDTGCERSRAFMAAVRGYAEAFLPGFTVRLNEPLDVAESRSPCRRDARTGHWQIHADGLLHYLKGLRAPGRSCLLGLTLADLYAGNSADFVFEKCLPAEGACKP
ncbi:archaemetzincin-2-like [Lampetra fluviatilis]